MLGRLLDQRYQVVEPLGKGGFGHTYIALDTRRPGNPTCVVKHLKPVTSDPEFLPTARRLFNREAETLEKLGNHDQIPRLLAYFEENEEFYLVQELIVGHPLSSEMPPGAKWSEEQAITLLQEVLPILEFIHSNQVIHRDLKPDNLIRRSDNKIVLVDFGAVKQVKSYSIMTPEQLKNETIAIGTPGYMPSEQGQGRPRPCSDIYALGMIAIQTLTGLSPIQLGEDSVSGEIVWQHHTEVSDQLAAILNKMVRHYFKYRYQSAKDALQALASITHANTPTAVAAVMNQMVGQYLTDGYMSATKVMHYIQELAKPCYIPPDHANHSWSIQPLTSTTKVMQYLQELTKPCYIPPDNETTPLVTSSASANPSTLLNSYRLNLHSIRQSPRLLIGAGVAIILVTLSIMSANQSPQTSLEGTAQQKVQQVASNKNASAQKQSCRVVASSSNLRSFAGSGRRRQKTGKVIKAGTMVTATGREEAGWIEISEPEPGWIWKNRTKNSCPTNK
ncbi:MAG: protein kinase [Nodularia sp. CChRGM 3473]